ncbi:MAG: DUF5106 domain-containing protein [Bacteroidaceae bacterium]|nr:DUF5106 domain-containing protein [Bacteroidaceae bacterium]
MRRLIILFVTVVSVLPMSIVAETSDGFFRLPQIPDSLTCKEDKAAWLVSHYWEGADFSRGTRQDIEQVFVDYITIIQISPREAFRNIPREKILADLADQYLNDKQSPFYDTARYAQYVRHALGDTLPDIKLMLVADAPLLGIASGTSIFLSKLKEGIMGKGEGMTLLFFDPDCDDCKSAIAQLANGGVGNVVAVNMNQSQTLPVMPPHWILCAIADERVYDLYPLRRLPFVANGW